MPARPALRMRNSKFKEELRKWRGRRSQSRAAALLDVKLRTFQNWEQGANTPNSYSQNMVYLSMNRTPDKPDT